MIRWLRRLPFILAAGAVLLVGFLLDALLYKAYRGYSRGRSGPAGEFYVSLSLPLSSLPAVSRDLTLAAFLRLNPTAWQIGTQAPAVMVPGDTVHALNVGPIGFHVSLFTPQVWQG